MIRSIISLHSFIRVRLGLPENRHFLTSSGCSCLPPEVARVCGDEITKTISRTPHSANGEDPAFRGAICRVMVKSSQLSLKIRELPKIMLDDNKKPA